MNADDSRIERNVDFLIVIVGLAFDVCKNVKGHEYDDANFWRGISKIGKEMGFNSACDNYSHPVTEPQHFELQYNVWYYMLSKDEKFINAVSTAKRVLYTPTFMPVAREKLSSKVMANN